MKKHLSEQTNAAVQETRPEYDFSAGVRGKHARSLRDGYTVKIHQSDGGTVIQNFTLEEGTVVLEPDVRQYFPNSEAVNAALRCLIPLLAAKRKDKAKA